MANLAAFVADKNITRSNKISFRMAGQPVPGGILSFDLSAEDLSKLYEKYEIPGDTTPGALFTKVLDYLNLAFEAEKAAAKPLPMDYDSVFATTKYDGKPLDSFFLLQDPTTLKKTWVDSVTSQPMEWHSSNNEVLNRVLDKLPKDQPKGDQPRFMWKCAYYREGRVFYNPYKAPGLSVCSETGNQLVNSYAQPSWETLPDLEPAEIHDRMEPLIKFLEYFFVDEASLSLAMRWLWDVLHNRPLYHLILCGDQGTGKSSIFGNICMHLVGLSNYGKGSTETLHSRFTPKINAKRLFLWEEPEIGPKGNRKFKEWVNEYAAVEQKFRDADDLEAIFCSHIVANNHITDNFIKVNDRVWLVPDITDEKLEKRWGKNHPVMRELIDEWPKDDRNLKAFYEWICNNYAGEPNKRAVNELHLGAKYRAIVQASLTEFYGHVFHHLLEHKSATLGYLRDTYNDRRAEGKTRVRWATVVKHLKDYNLKIDDVFTFEDLELPEKDRRINMKVPPKPVDDELPPARQ